MEIIAFTLLTLLGVLIFKWSSEPDSILQTLNLNTHGSYYFKNCHQFLRSITRIKKLIFMNNYCFFFVNKKYNSILQYPILVFIMFQVVKIERIFYFILEYSRWGFSQLKFLIFITIQSHYCKTYGIHSYYPISQAEDIKALRSDKRIIIFAEKNIDLKEI